MILLRIGDGVGPDNDGAAFGDPLEIVDNDRRIDAGIAGIPNGPANGDILAALHGRLGFEPSGTSSAVPGIESGAVHFAGAFGAEILRESGVVIANIEKRDIHAHRMLLAIERNVAIDCAGWRGIDQRNELVVVHAANVFRILERVKLEAEFVAGGIGRRA